MRNGNTTFSTIVDIISIPASRRLLELAAYMSLVAVRLKEMNDLKALSHCCDSIQPLMMHGSQDTVA